MMNQNVYTVATPPRLEPTAVKLPMLMTLLNGVIIVLFVHIHTYDYPNNGSKNSN